MASDMFGRSTMPITKPSQQTTKGTSVPASVGGVNRLSSLMEMPGNDCIYTFNMMPAESGMRLRKGYREWATGVNGDVRTILSYEGRDQNDNEMWAVTENGIYKVSLYNTTAPVEDVAFTVQGIDAGWGVHTEFVSDANEKFLFYADGLNGLHQYQTAAGWSVPAGWTYDDPANPGTQIPFPVADIAFIMSHKLRLWVVLENSSDAYYLPLYSIAGELKKFTFGAKMPHGGNLVGLWTWSLDGGEGLDDYLIAISRSGDVLVYKGDDPEISADSPDTAGGPWTLIGSWFIGELPNSRRIAESQGSELYILSIYGITSLRDLLQGSAADENGSSPSKKVNRPLRADVQSGKGLPGWAIQTNPSDGFMQVITPEPSSGNYVQYNQNLTTKAWGFWEDVPMISADTWNGEYFIGAPDGVVYIYDGGYDKGTLSGDTGANVAWRQLTSFQALGNHAAYKRIHFIRPIGILQGTASVNTQAIFDYNVAPIVDAPTTLPPTDASLWDSAVWDLDLWDAGISGGSIPLGASGIGRAVAIAMRGNAGTRLTLIGWDLLFDDGGML